MATLTELQEKRGRLVTQAREALNEITANTDEARSAELESRHDTIMADFDKVEKDIAREERMAAVEARFAARTEEERARRRPGAGSESEGRGQETGGDEKLSYRSVFYKFLASGADMSDLEPEERAVLKAGVAEAYEQRENAALPDWTAFDALLSNHRRH